ncbi:hypothetical protein BV898_13976 [Hypsibius exemplaris]|uniref:MADF domain-containing protein n=1 Tax=Hypsibius exemplaris TaxID=2072580 RepID=A0A1W0W944_HYPEX|nr:hypothetical protein BV898_13976 [Hypsibius exemplaris]
MDSDRNFDTEVTAEVRTDEENAAEDEFRIRLIAEVQNNPAVYSKVTPNGRNRVGREKAWRKIAAALHEFVGDHSSNEQFARFCEVKFVSMRNNYNRHLKRLGTLREDGTESKPYKFAPLLEFLRPLFKARGSRNVKLNLAAANAAINARRAAARETDEDDEEEDWAAANGISEEAHEEQIEAPSLLSSYDPLPGSDNQSTVRTRRHFRGRGTYSDVYVKPESIASSIASYQAPAPVSVSVPQASPPKLDEIDHQVRIWEMKIRRFSGKARRELIKKIADLIDESESAAGLDEV